MSAAAKPATRYKHQMVAADLLFRIQSGEWRKGTKVPSIDELALAYPYARMTVVKAMEFLIGEGFLETRRGVGTFVARDRVAGTIGLVIGEEVLHPQQTPMAFMLSQHLRRYFDRLGYRFRLYIDSSPGVPAIPPELREDVAGKRLEGLITASCDTTLALPEWLGWEQARLPHVDITAHQVPVSQVVTDSHALVDLFLLYCLQRRRRRIGCLMGTGPVAEYLVTQGRQLGLEPRERWCRRLDPCGVDYERIGFDAMQELWQSTERPDALLVLDDIACKGAVQAMLQLGIAVPSELLVATLSNKDSGVFYPLPLARIEYDVGEVARAAGELLLEHLADPHLAPRQVLVKPTLLPLPATSVGSAGAPVVG